MSLTTEHRGYTIRYSENGDEWVCYDAGDGLSAPTLSKLKEKIDRLVKEADKAGGITALRIDTLADWSRGVDLIEARLVAYAGPDLDRVWGRNSKVTGHQVEAIFIDPGNSRATRRKRSLATFAPDSVQTRVAVVEANKIAAQMRALRKDYEAAIAAIPRLSLADIEELVKRSGIDPTGGIEEGKA